MKIFVFAKPSAKENKVEKIDTSHFRVFVKEPPVKGMANKAIIKLLGEYFSVPSSHVTIVRGMFAKEKVVDIVE